MQRVFCMTLVFPTCCFPESTRSSWSTQTWAKPKAGWGWLMSSWTHLYLILMEQRYSTNIISWSSDCPPTWSMFPSGHRCFFLFADWRPLQCSVTAALFVRVSLKHRLYWETQSEGGRWADVSLVNILNSHLNVPVDPCCFILCLQMKKTTLTGPVIWWRVRTSTLDRTQTPLWVSHNHGHCFLTQMSSV